MGAMHIPPHVSSLYAFPNRSRLRAVSHILLMTLSFFIISATVVLYSLGYKVNWSARSVQQTGTIIVDSKIAGMHPQVYLNNKLVDSDLPVKSAYLFPGWYYVEIKKNGYQSWQRLIELEANKVVAFRTVVLVKDPPSPLPVDSSTMLGEVNQKDIEIRENELWVKGKFLTRSGEDIVTAAWYPDNAHIVYQSGRDLLLADLDARVTQKILTLKTKTPLQFSFKENGRVLLYQEDGQIKAVGLYEKF